MGFLSEFLPTPKSAASVLIGTFVVKLSSNIDVISLQRR